MSYLVLARKWRPRRFSELVGQLHVVRALSNALESGRVHHAFLFTGTRGVGKTTIARIFAKSLNCEQGTSAEPCGVCNACRDIDAGRYVDLLEIDAASHTGVDNVRDLIDNAQYMPARGRTKVYLIDEVHMLSKPAFNALLKTLEEPPEHVKFLLATTDPDKLPVTVLSRCLQFNLKRLDVEQIEGQIARILEAEGIASDPASRRLLAKAADGSLRDGLSLLDQAIAYGGGALDETAVREMLGSVDRHRIDVLLAALAQANGEGLMNEVAALAELSPDFSAVLDELAATLHRVQLLQLVPTLAGIDAEPSLSELAGALEPELVQLWYRMALDGRVEIPLAPSARTGFEMVLLRMLAFRPAAAPAIGAGSSDSAGRASPPASRSAAPVATDSTRPVSRQTYPVGASASAEANGRGDASSDPPPPTAAVRQAPHSVAETAAPSSLAESSRAPAGSASAGLLSDNESWLALLARLELRGPSRELAAHSVFGGYEDGTLSLALGPGLAHLGDDALVQRLAEALAPWLGQLPRIRLSEGPEAGAETLHQRALKTRSDRQQQAERTFLSDTTVQHLIQRYGAQVQPDSIHPVEDN